MHRTPLEQVCLSIKALGLGSIRAFLANALEPPGDASVTSAIDTLHKVIQITSPNFFFMLSFDCID